MTRAVPRTHRPSRLAVIFGISTLLAFAAPVSGHPDASNAEVSVGSPHDVVTTSHQNEPVVAMDAHAPNSLVAGSNDYSDQQVCPEDIATGQATCDDFT